ncbi:N-acetylmuramoyl-L-alanine amidase [Aliiroseovarius sp. YM-037]|uniref:N-acetylmuramoyl-L-alanine amidase n=1 Tax=Aliiroseovarius sp. YM-037 TaxID=3341728 RepID=UPI003A7FD2B4
MNPRLIQQKITEAVQNNDLGAIQTLQKDLLQETDYGEQPYDAAIELKPELRAQLETSFEGATMVNWANRLARAERLVNYRLKTLFGFDGTRIVSEGDSWFQYPLLLDDLIDQVSFERDFAVFSLGAAGDLVQRMTQQREYKRALQDTKSPILLLSGGGNDLLGDGRFENLLLPFSSGAAPEDLVNKAALDQVSREILGFYRQILTDVRDNHPGVMVFGHAYDTPFPKNGGKYFGAPLKNVGIDLKLGRKVIEVILDDFSGRLNQLAPEFPNYQFVNMKGTVGDHPNSWRDELHPESKGFERAAKPLIGAIRAHLSSSGFEAASAEANDATTVGVWPFESDTVGRTIVLDPGHGGTASLGGSSWNNAIGPSGTLEKTWTLDVCQRARDVLTARGHTVLVTRDTDMNVSIEGRRKVARDARAGCFVSVHFNASTAHNAQGTETYVHPTTTSAASILLMRRVQKAMVAELGLTNRNDTRSTDGILRGSFGVIRENRHHADTAVCLHEVSFMDRIDEENRIKTETYRECIAKALADGIDAFFGAGTEAADAFELVAEYDFEDAIHANAVASGLSIPQFLGLAEAPPGGGLTARGASSLGVPFESAAGQTLLDTMFAQAARTSEYVEPDRNEDVFLDGSQGIDFSTLDQGAVEHLEQFRAAYAGFESSGFDFAAFSAFVAGLGLRHFSATELLFLGNSNAGGSCKGKNAPPPRSLWNNIANTARMLDEIRERIGHPVKILSGYRNSAYNSCVRGASGSLHMKYNAIDWTASGRTIREWHEIAKKVRSENPAFIGGIGRYDSKNFVHIDTRGSDVDWIKP